MADLIVCFSRNYENYVSGAIRNLDVGNTEVVACIIQQLTGADLFKLEPIQEYSRNYNECIAEAQADQRRNARPELRSYPENLDGYDTVYLGFQIIGGQCLWRYLPFWNILTGVGRRSVLSAPMRAAAWDEAKWISGDFAGERI